MKGIPIVYQVCITCVYIPSRERVHIPPMTKRESRKIIVFKHTDWGKICNRSQGGYTRKHCHASGLSQMQPGSGWGPTFLFSQLHQSFFARGDSRVPCWVSEKTSIGSTWRIIPVSMWLITMVSKFPKWGYSPYKWPKWLINGGY